MPDFVCAVILMTNSMQSSLVRCLWLSTLLCACVPLGLAQQSNPPVARSAQPSQSVAPEFAQSRKLMQQGKLDEAIAELHSLEAGDPSMRGLDGSRRLRAVHPCAMGRVA